MQRMKWLVYACCWFVAVINCPLPYAFGAMFVHMLDKYGESRAKTATVQAVFIGIHNIFCVIGGWLVKRFGVPKVSFAGSLCVSTGFFVASFADSILVLNIAIGAIAGLGVTMTYMPSTVVIGRLFKQSTVKTAIAFQTFAVGIGIIIYPHILNAVCTEYGVSGTFLVTSGILFNNIVFTLVFYIHDKRFVHMPADDDTMNRKRDTSNFEDLNQSTGPERVVQCVQPAHDGTTRARDRDDNHSTSNDEHRNCPTDGKNNAELSSKLKMLSADFAPMLNVRFLLVTLATAAIACSISGVLVVAMDLLKTKNISSIDALRCFTAYTIGSTASRGFFTIMSMAVQQYNAFIAAVLCAVCGVAGQLLILFVKHIYFIFVGFGLTGFSLGGTLCNAAIIVASTIRTDLFALAFGLIVSVMGIFSLATGPIYGYIRDNVRSYEGALIITIAMLGVATALFSTVAVLRQWKTRKL